jgi:uncharacterized membrane protein YhhN
MSGLLLLKGLSSLFFVITGVTNLVYLVRSEFSDLLFPILITLGLFFSMLGDIALNIQFIIGAALFAVGHIFYFAAYIRKISLCPRDFILIFAIFLPSALFLSKAPFLDFGTQLMKNICVFYALVISCMVGKALSNVTKERNTANLLLALGAVMFYFSDLMLVFHKFAGSAQITSALCLGSYYPAQCLIAYSLSHVSKEQENLR